MQYFQARRQVAMIASDPTDIRAPDTVSATTVPVIYELIRSGKLKVRILFLLTVL